MGDEDEKIEQQIECELCGKKCWALYPIILAKDYPFYNRRGICKECYKEDLDKIGENILKKNLKTIKEQIEKSRERVEFWQNELSKLEAKKIGEKNG